MSEESFPSVTIVSLAIALLAMPVAGCISGDAPSFESYSEARDAPGVVLSADQVPDQEAHNVHLKTLAPADSLEDVRVDEMELAFLLFDEELDEPVTDAEITMDVWKTHEDTFSSNTEAPSHTGHGVYEGIASFDKEGGWVVDLDVTLSDGTTLEWPLHFHAGEPDHTHDSHIHQDEDDHGHDHDH